MTKLEEVARAMFARGHDESWDETDAPVHKIYLDDARAAVEALREPGEGMTARGLEALVEKFEAGGVRGSHETDAVWQAMLTAILEEG